MSVTYISAELRRHVSERANWACEYCLIAEDNTFLGCACDHIISEKHGGATNEENLAYACVLCNQAKGSDIGSIDWETGEFTRFFNPRVDSWEDHFTVAGPRLVPRTSIGRVTERILALNAPARVAERIEIQAACAKPRRPD